MRILIIEDEAPAAQLLQSVLQKLRPDSEVLAVLDSVEDSITWLKSHPEPDLILQDLQLADGLSLEIFTEVKVEAPVIFTTAYDDYALEAFKVNSVDYLLKPIKESELQAAIEKLEKRQAAGPVIDYAGLMDQISGGRYQKRFLIRFGQKLKTLNIEDIAWLYSESKVSMAVTRKGKHYPLDPSLDQIQQMLDPAVFFRINRQYIINIKAISEMQIWSKGRVRLTLDPPCEKDTIVSVERSRHFKQWLAGL